MNTYPSFIAEDILLFVVKHPDGTTSDYSKPNLKPFNVELGNDAVTIADLGVKVDLEDVEYVKGRIVVSGKTYYVDLMKTPQVYSIEGETKWK